MWVQKVQGFKDAIRGRPAPGEATVDEIADGADATPVSNYRTQFMDAEDEADRVQVSWAGLPDILEKFQELLANIADIPMTRWNSQSPAGMNATGKADANNYALHVGGMQKRILDPVLKRLDPFIARHAGLAEPPEYEWVDLTDVSELEQAQIDDLRVKQLETSLNMAAMDEPEARERLSKIEWFGELSADFEPPTDPVEEMKLEMLKAGPPGGNGNGGPPPRRA